MDNYNIGEIYQFAIRIEENGEKAYKYFAEKFSANSEIRNLFLHLAEQEIHHKNIFEVMVAKIEDYSLESQYPDDYFLYIRAFADAVLFSKKNIEKESIKTIEEAFDFAMKKELDTINYYNALKNYVSYEYHEKIDDIIKEEQKHFLALYNTKEKTN
ncbi:MAG TPA: ferritin family protein [Spirochaetota bacterium]|nr:ferritin family protein [Spirochaetota bacterium]